jgi:hypothetical protein
LGYKAKWEYFRAVYERYRKAGREAKHLMLNEFCLNTGYHRKYAIRLLNDVSTVGPRVTFLNGLTRRESFPAVAFTRVPARDTISTRSTESRADHGLENFRDSL